MTKILTTALASAEQIADGINNLDSDEIEAFARELQDGLDDDAAEILVAELSKIQSAKAIP